MDIIKKFKIYGHQDLVPFIFSFLDFHYNIYVILNERKKKKGRSLTIITYPLSEFLYKEQALVDDLSFISKSI